MIDLCPYKDPDSEKAIFLETLTVSKKRLIFNHACDHDKYICTYFNLHVATAGTVYLNSRDSITTAEYPQTRYILERKDGKTLYTESRDWVAT